MRRSLVFAFFEKGYAALLAVLLMVLVSRLLTPAEVGLFLVASAGVILVETFRDFGVTSCIVREHRLTPDFLRGAFTLVTMLSALLGTGLWVLAEPAARLYGTPDLAPLIRIASLGFVFAPVSAIRIALLRRDMAFGQLAAIGIASGSAGAVVTVALAAGGLGPQSLSWGSVAAACVSAGGAMLVRPQWDSFRPSLAHWRQILAFGGWTSMVTLVGLMSEQVPRLLLGRLMGLDALGHFYRALALTQLPDRMIIGAVQPVIFAEFSRQARQSTPLAKGYLTALEMISSVQWPLLACLALLADPLVHLLLGPQWLDVIPLLRIVAIAGMALFPVPMTFPALVATGAVRDNAVLQLVLFPLTVGIIGVAALNGMTAVALSLLLLNPMQAVMTLWVVRRRLEFDWAALLQGMGRSAVLSIAAMAPSLLMLATTGPTLLGLVAAGLATLPCWAAAVVAMQSPLSTEVMRLVARLRRQPRGLRA